MKISHGATETRSIENVSVPPCLLWLVSYYV